MTKDTHRKPKRREDTSQAARRIVDSIIDQTEADAPKEPAKRAVAGKK
jgi:hypothetical protein